MKRNVVTLLLACCLGTALISGCQQEQSEAGDITRIKDKLAERHEHADDIRKSELPNIYEIVIAGKSMFTDRNMDFFIAGDLYETKTGRNLSTTRMLGKLPLEKAVKTGNGSRTLVTFEDPNCGYCRKLYSELGQMNDITVYTFIVPILGEDSLIKTRSLVCAKDTGKAWKEWMRAEDRKLPDASEIDEKCNPNTEIERNVILAKQFGVRGTPFILFQNGQVLNGFAPASKLEALLTENVR